MRSEGGGKAYGDARAHTPRRRLNEGSQRIRIDYFGGIGGGGVAGGPSVSRHCSVRACL